MYVAGTGTGYKGESVAIFTFHKNTLKSLWTHTLREHAFILPLEDGTVEEYEWKISEDGQEIRVEGLRMVYPKPEKLGDPGGPPTSHTLPTETFCWDSGRVVYVACPRSQ